MIHIMLLKPCLSITTMEDCQYIDTAGLAQYRLVKHDAG